MSESDSSSTYSLAMGNHVAPSAPQPSMTHQHHHLQHQHHTGLLTHGSAAASLVSRVVKGMTGDTSASSSSVASTLVPAVSSETPRQSSATIQNRQTDVVSVAKGQPLTQRVNVTTKPSSSSSYSRTGDDVGRPDEGSTDRFSALLTASVIDDHFDQYITTPSTGPTLFSPRGGRFRTDPRHPDTTASGQQDDGLRLTPQRCNDLSSDSGVSSVGEMGADNGGLSRGPLALLHRRKTLAAAGQGLLPVVDTTPSSSSRGEDGINRPSVTWAADRLKENGIGPTSRISTTTTTTTTPYSSYGRGGNNSGDVSVSRPTPLHPPAVSMFRSTLRKSPNMGSMPDVSEGSGSGSRSGSGSGSASAMPREEVHVLSVRRREEIRRQREEEERRRRQEIVLRFSDIKVSKIV